APQLLESDQGRTALMEVIFFNVCAEFKPDLILLAGIYNTWSCDALADVQDNLGIPVVLWSGDNPYAPWAPDIFSRSPYYELALFGNVRFAESASDSFARCRMWCKTQASASPPRPTRGTPMNASGRHCNSSLRGPVSRDGGVALRAPPWMSFSSTGTSRTHCGARANSSRAGAFPGCPRTAQGCCFSA
ncbi:MAG: hypothetical protein GY772_32985, partial [bacterium]|nr:hypothetical protein [bacterium]